MLIVKENLALRAMRNDECDMKLMLKWLTTPEVIRWVYGEGAPWTLEAVTAKFVKKTKAGSDTVPCFILLDGRAIGYVQFSPIKEDSYRFGSREVFEEVKKGYGIDMFIGEPQLWNRGIGARAVSLVAEYLLQSLGIPVMCADPAQENERAVYFWQKAGFVPIDVVEDYDDSTQKSILMMKTLY